ncbi:MAG: hypothetical protein ACR652_15040 [Methylocystis sp.]|uniref:hypothetical protein n=1 Tax=Methylocystis sp. TaxID=1911079 RepID=UPI003DA4150C
MIDKTQPGRKRRYGPKLRALLIQASIALRAQLDELEAENAELRRRLDEAIGVPVLPSLLEKLSPGARIEFDRCRRGLKGESDEEKLVSLVEMFLRSSARNRVSDDFTAD